MCVYDLLEILEELQEQERREDNPIMIEDNSSSDDGLLEEEEKAKEEEYVEMRRCEPFPVESQHLTRATARKKNTQTHSLFHNQEELGFLKRKKKNRLIVKKKKKPVAHGEQSSKSDEDVGNRPTLEKKKKKKKKGELRKESIEGEQENENSNIDTVIVITDSETEWEKGEQLLGSRDILLNVTFRQREDVLQYARQIVDTFATKWSDKLTDIFRAHVTSVLPSEKKTEIEALVELYKRHTVSSDIPTIITDLDTDIAGYARKRTHTSVLFALIFRSLVYSTCSEASVERLFSLLRYMSGKRRYNLNVASLRAALQIRSRRLKRIKSVTS